MKTEFPLFLVPLAAYPLQLGGRLQLAVSGSYQRRGGRYPGESTSVTLSPCKGGAFSFQTRGWRLGLDQKQSPALVEVLTGGGDRLNEQTRTHPHSASLCKGQRGCPLPWYRRYRIQLSGKKQPADHAYRRVPSGQEMM